MKKYSRNSANRVREALADTPVVLVTGARRAGKSTLAQMVMAGEPSAEFVSLDHDGPRTAALNDPMGFVAGLNASTVIDEVQRGGPRLLLAIKAAVDEKPVPGRFLLTGSANPLVGKNVPDTLTGRIEPITIWPLAQSEIRAGERNFVDDLFSGDPPRIEGATVGRAAFVEPVVAGGFPEALQRSGRRRRAWFGSYLGTVGAPDLSELTNAHRLAELPGLLRVVATQSANLLVYRELGRKLGLTHKTAKSYLQLLAMSYVVRVLPGWRPSIASQEIATPKVYVTDSGLLAHMLRADAERLARDDQVTGKCLETFVVMEVLKHLEWSEIDADPFHYRMQSGEVDLVLESWAGEVAAVEVKARASLSARDWRPLARLRDRLGDRFAAGYIIHSGPSTVPLGDRLWAVPISALWA